MEYLIPKNCIENFSELHEVYLSLNWPKSPKIILTSTAHINNDLFKYYAAQKQNSGSKLFIHQHGGGFGPGNSNLGEYFERRISSKFITWGWGYGLKKIIPFRFNKIKNLNINKTKSSRGIILSCINGYNLPGRMFNGPRDIYKTIKYNNNIIDLFKNLDKNILKFSKISFNDFNREPNLKSIIKKNFPSLLVSRHDQSLLLGIDRKNTVLNQSKKFKLIVETLDSTGFIEAMFYNIPVVLLLDRSFMILDRSNTKKIYKLLERENIVFYCPKKLSIHINNSYSKIEKWWYSQKLQRCRKIFCETYAKDTNHYGRELKLILKKEAKSQ